MQLLFHFRGVYAVILNDLLQVIIIEGGIDNRHFIYISQLPQVIAGQNITVADMRRQRIDPNP